MSEVTKFLKSIHEKLGSDIYAAEEETLCAVEKLELDLEQANKDIQVLAKTLSEAATCLDMTGEAHPRTGDWIEIANSFINKYKDKA